MGTPRQHHASHCLRHLPLAWGGLALVLSLILHRDPGNEVDTPPARELKSKTRPAGKTASVSGQAFTSPEAWAPGGIAMRLASTDPRHALALAERIDDAGLRHHARLRCLGEWALLDPEGAAAWAGKIPEEAERPHALAEVAAAWASFDPPAAAGFASDFIASHEALERAIPAVIAQAGPCDQPAMRAWVASFHEGELKDLAQAEFTRLARKVPAAPASLPGESTEHRDPFLPKKPKNP